MRRDIEQEQRYFQFLRVWTSFFGLNAENGDIFATVLRFGRLH